MDRATGIDIVGGDDIAVAKTMDGDTAVYEIDFDGASGAHVIEEEATPLTQRAALNFEGAGVAVTDDAANDATVVTISGGGGGGHSIEEEGTPLTARSKLNFVGAGVTVTDDSGDDASVVTIPGGGAPTVRCDARRSTQQTGIITATITPVDWTAADLEDTDGMHDPSSNPHLVNINTDGLYLLEATICWTQQTTGLRAIGFRVNGSTYYGWVVATANVTVGPVLSTSFSVPLDASDSVEVVIYHTRGSNHTTDGSNSTLGANNMFKVTRIGDL